MKTTTGEIAKPNYATLRMTVGPDWYSAPPVTPHGMAPWCALVREFTDGHASVTLIEQLAPRTPAITRYFHSRTAADAWLTECRYQRTPNLDR